MGDAPLDESTQFPIKRKRQRKEIEVERGGWSSAFEQYTL